MGFRDAHERRLAAPWIVVFFFSFLLGAGLSLIVVSRAGADTLSAWSLSEKSGYFLMLAELCVPVLGAFLCGFSALGVFLLPCLFIWRGYAFSLPIAAAVRLDGANGFLAAFLAVAPQNFIAIPLLFLVAVYCAFCAASAFSVLIGRAGMPRRSPLSPPLPLILGVTGLLLALVSLYSLVRLRI
ncbi:MAG: hypothetical protein VB111_12750 [Clostridiaceae bacterium]|nr:hypothetical protein [Clostridiaceae bacterium]